MAGKGTNHRRETADSALALALARGMTLTDAAMEAGISFRTAIRRWTEPEFRRDVERIKTDIVSAAVAETAASMSKAAKTLTDLLDSLDERIKLQAARTVMEMALKGRQIEEIERKQQELLDRLNRLDPPKADA